MGHFLSRNVKIYATDVDERNFGDLISRGVYPEQELKRIPPEIVGRYSSPNGEAGRFKISDEIRSAVQFQRHDSLSLQAVRADFGLIVCKNVLLHFTPEERVEVIRMFHGGLIDGGCFVTEQTQRMPPECEPLFHQVTNAAQLFQTVNGGISIPQTEQILALCPSRVLKL
jgi:chemotaxis protein methyltransferase CheR